MRAVATGNGSAMIIKTFNQETKDKYIEYFFHEDHLRHKTLDEQTGIPLWLSSLIDKLLDGATEESRTIPVEFIKAIPVDMSHEDLLRKVQAPFLVMALKKNLNTFDHKEYPEVKKIVDDVIRLWQRDDIGSDDFKKAAAAAVDAAYKIATATAVTEYEAAIAIYAAGTAVCDVLVVYTFAADTAYAAATTYAAAINASYYIAASDCAAIYNVAVAVAYCYENNKYFKDELILLLEGLSK